MDSHNKKYDAAETAARIFATILFPEDKGMWKRAHKRVKEILLEEADHLMVDHTKGRLGGRKKKKEYLRRIREYYKPGGGKNK